MKKLPAYCLVCFRIYYVFPVYSLKLRGLFLNLLKSKNVGKLKNFLRGSSQYPLSRRTTRSQTQNDATVPLTWYDQYCNYFLKLLFV